MLDVSVHIIVLFLIWLNVAEGIKCEAAGWRTKHSNCWGDCVRVAKSGRTYTMSAAQIATSCSAERDQQTDTTEAGDMPDCSYISMSRDKNMRAYCTNILRPIPHTPPVVGESSMVKDMPSCENAGCESTGVYKTGQFCKQENDGDEKDVTSCKQCPIGSQHTHVMGCIYMRPEKRTATRICQVVEEAVQIRRIGGYCTVQWVAANFPGGTPPDGYKYSKYDCDTGELVGHETETAAKESYYNLLLAHQRLPHRKKKHRKQKLLQKLLHKRKYYD